MAPKLRSEYPGAIYHVMNRGDRRDAIFHDDRDRELFLTALDFICFAVRGGCRTPPIGMDTAKACRIDPH